MNNYLFEQKAVFAFNIWSIDSARAVIDAAAEKKTNVILQTSSGVFEKIAKKQLREFVSSYASDQGIRAWLHLDHCRKTTLVREAVDWAWDSVMIDASDRSVGENIAATNAITGYAHEQGVLVEAEVGQIRGAEDNIVYAQSQIASLEDIDRFLRETEVDMIAAAFGNAHGIYQSEPQLHYEIVEYITEKTEIPFVVHGGSGMTDGAVRRLLEIPNVRKINISTDVKLAYREGIMTAYKNGLMERDGFQAVDVEHLIHESIGSMVRSRLSLLSE